MLGDSVLQIDGHELRMDYCETKNILKRIEVTVAMQERVPFLQAKRGD